MSKKRNLSLNHAYEHGLKRELITELSTRIGYMQVLEYTLQDFSYLHVVIYSIYAELDNNNIPSYKSKSFYRDKQNALKFAQELGNNLLNQF